MPFRFDSGLHCREATMEDISDMVELLRQLFSIERDFNFSPEKHESGLQMLLRSSSSRVFVAERQGHVIGMCTLQTLISTAEGDLVGMIEDVVVADGSRREGIGSLLLETVTEWAQTAGLKRLQLLADRDNIPAFEFYRKYRWSQTHLLCVRKLL